MKIVHVVGRHSHHSNNLALREISSDDCDHISIVSVTDDIVEQDNGVDVEIAKIENSVETAHFEDVITKHLEDEVV